MRWMWALPIRRSLPYVSRHRMCTPEHTAPDVVLDAKTYRVFSA